MKTGIGPDAATLVLALALAASCAAPAFADPFVDPRADTIPAIEANAGFTGLPRDPACAVPKLVAAGAPAPQDRQTLALRWAGDANYELAYNRRVILLDAFYDRGSNYPPLGVSAATIAKADVILIGSAHFDDMADAAAIAKRTGAVVVGAPITTQTLARQGVPERQLRTVFGRAQEKLFFDGFTVQPVLALEGEPDKHIAAVMGSALDALTPKLTPAQQAAQQAIAARGSADPHIATEGAIAYIVTFDDGFRLVYRDSAGRPSDYERQIFAHSPGVDLAIVALSPDYLEPQVAAEALGLAKLYKPDVFMPAHHDAAVSGPMPLWRATEPVFQALKDADPLLVTVSREYREPTCFDTEVNIANGRTRVAPGG